jgi:hypothetical protein
MMNITEALRRNQASLRREYIQLLQHFDTSDTAHAGALNRLRAALGLTAQQVQADFAIVGEIRLHQLTLVDDGEGDRLAAEQAEAEAAVARGFEDSKAFQARWKERQTKLTLAMQHAQTVVTGRAESKRDARRALKELAEKRPDLFIPDEDDDSTNPPHRAA